MKTLSAIFAVLTAWAVAAEPSVPSKTATYQSSISQEALRGATQRLKEEIAVLIADYSQYPGASVEVAALKDAAKTLDNLATNDMASVSRALLEASRSMDAGVTNENVSKASSTQKSIQVSLRKLADKLAQQGGQAAMQKRLEDLAIRQHANLQATREITKQPKMPENLRPEAQEEFLKQRSRWEQQVKDEQKALDQETRLATQALAKSAEAADPAIAKFMKEAAATAQTKELDQRSGEAAVAIEKDPLASVGKQEEVMETLKSMISSLDNAKTAEERARQLAGELADMAQKQEALVNRTPRLPGWAQPLASKDQQEIASRLEVMKDLIAKQDKDSAATAAESSETSIEAAEALSDQSLRKDASRLAKTAENQKNVATNLSKMAETLQKQANALAGMTELPQLSPEEAALNNAIAQLTEAQNETDLASLQNEQGQEVQSRVESASQKIEEARAQMKTAGPSVPADVDVTLQAALDHAQKAAANKEVNHNLFHVRKNVNEALTALQNAANELATKPKEATDPGEGEGKGKGGLGFATSDLTNKYDARGVASEAQRAALNAARQGKVAPSYEPMVSQYYKNLTEQSGDDR